MYLVWDQVEFSKKSLEMKRFYWKSEVNWAIFLYFCFLK